MASIEFRRRQQRIKRGMSESFDSPKMRQDRIMGLERQERGFDRAARVQIARVPLEAERVRQAGLERTEIVKGFAGIHKQAADLEHRRTEAALERSHTTSEREGTQKYKTGEREGTQKYKTGEREATQKYKTGEREATQKFQAAQAKLIREHETSLAEMKLDSAEWVAEMNAIAAQAKSGSLDAEGASTMYNSLALRERDLQAALREAKKGSDQATQIAANLEALQGTMADLEGQIVNRRQPGLERQGEMSQDDFIAEFQAEEGRAPTEAEIRRARGRYWR